MSSEHGLGAMSQARFYAFAEQNTPAVATPVEAVREIGQRKRFIR